MSIKIMHSVKNVLGSTKQPSDPIIEYGLSQPIDATTSSLKTTIEGLIARVKWTSDKK